MSLGGFCTTVQDGLQGTEKAKLLLAAAVARARAYDGSSPENLMPYFLPLSQKVSRRALFTLPPLRYRVVVSVNDQQCIADVGCAFCVTTCPRDALGTAEGKVWIDKALCDGCGLCVATCPKDAVQFPGNSPVQLDAEINALLEAGPVALSERRILFACRRGVQALLQVRLRPDKSGWDRSSAQRNRGRQEVASSAEYQ